jgi:hypothetical protein
MSAFPIRAVIAPASESDTDRLNALEEGNMRKILIVGGGELLSLATALLRFYPKLRFDEFETVGRFSLQIHPKAQTT